MGGAAHESTLLGRVGQFLQELVVSILMHGKGRWRARGGHEFTMVQERGVMAKVAGSL